MYVIESTIEYDDKKTGKHVKHVSYFQQHVNVVLPMNLMSNLEGAKRYEYISDARRELRQYFHNGKGTKVIKLKEQTV